MLGIIAAEYKVRETQDLLCDPATVILDPISMSLRGQRHEIPAELASVALVDLGLRRSDTISPAKVPAAFLNLSLLSDNKFDMRELSIFKSRLAASRPEKRKHFLLRLAHL